jgi:uncharacterized coiled-coil DUF342 family protein
MKLPELTCPKIDYIAEAIKSSLKNCDKIEFYESWAETPEQYSKEIQELKDRAREISWKLSDLESTLEEVRSANKELREKALEYMDLYLELFKEKSKEKQVAGITIYCYDKD